MKSLFVIFLSAICNLAFSQAWQQLMVNTSSNLHSVFFLDADTGYTVGQNGVIFKTTDGGANWDG